MKARMLALSVLLAVFSLTGSSFAADTRFIPITIGQTFEFAVSDNNPSTPDWTENIAVSGLAQIPPSLLYYTLDQKGQGESRLIGIRSTAADVRQYDGFGKEYIIWKKAAVGTVWSYIENSGQKIQRKIEAIENVTVPAGTFTNCLKIHNKCANCSGVTDWYEWVKPGFMMVKWVDYWADNAPVTHRLKSWTAPAAP
ncbi:MAG: hypothetical protein WC291_01690 [Thermodesulfovibrionales bacterium]|jgi:hypothetical protein